MGDFGLWVSRPVCARAGCGRRAYVAADEHRFLCNVCDATDRILWTKRMLKGRPAEASAAGSSGAFAAFWARPAVSTLAFEFAFGDGWRRQCGCDRCLRGFLSEGGVCPVHEHRARYLHVLDNLYERAGYTARQLYYTDWDVAVLRLHEMSTNLVPWNRAVLLAPAEASARERLAEERAASAQAGHRRT